MGEKARGLRNLLLRSFFFPRVLLRRLLCWRRRRRRGFLRGFPWPTRFTVLRQDQLLLQLLVPGVCAGGGRRTDRGNAAKRLRGGLRRRGSRQGLHAANEEVAAHFLNSYPKPLPLAPSVAWRTAPRLWGARLGLGLHLTSR